MSEEEKAIAELTATNALLVTAVNVTKANIEARIASAVVISENATLVPLANSVVNLLTTQTLLMNILNQ